jgi:hypothetical protein
VSRARWPQAARLLALLALLACAADGARAQERLVGAATAASGVVVENWSLPTPPLVAEPSGSPMYVRGVTQVTVPLGAVVPLGHGWSADVYGAYAVTHVRLARPTADGSTGFTLDGLTDARVRLIGRLADRPLTLTLGADAPTGRTSLTSAQLSALSVTASPALQLRTPGLGGGGSGTVGLLAAPQLGAWVAAVGASYEYRAVYSPTAAFEAGLTTGSLRPGGVLHVTAGAARVSGAFRHTLDVAADVTASGSLRLAAGNGDPAQRFALAAGPTYTALYQLDATSRRDVTSGFVVARRRGQLSVAGNVYPGSARDELQVGGQVVHTRSSHDALRLALDGRYQSVSHEGAAAAAAGAPSPFAAAGVRALAATVAWHIQRSAPRLGAEPFARLQVARLYTSDAAYPLTGVSGGLTIDVRF